MILEIVLMSCCIREPKVLNVLLKYKTVKIVVFAFIKNHS